MRAVPAVGPPPRGGWLRSSAHVIDRPLFWAGAFVVFATNAVLSAATGHWLLAALQALTALLSVASALAATAPDDPRDSFAPDPPAGAAVPAHDTPNTPERWTIP